MKKGGTTGKQESGAPLYENTNNGLVSHMRTHTHKKKTKNPSTFVI